VNEPTTSENIPGSTNGTQVVEVGSVRFGNGSFSVIAGPCAVESEQQMLEAAHIAAEGGASMLRGGAFKPRTSPYSWQGLGREGLLLLEQAGRETGLPTVTEVIEPADTELVAGHADMLQVGARNMQNFALLKAVGQTGKPIMLKRGLAATIDEWLMAAEYIFNEGNHRVVLCERGIRTFEGRTRNTLDISAIPVVRQLSHLPVIVDPSHASGDRTLIAPLALAGRAVGADGMMVEVHPEPDRALSDAAQQLDRAGFFAMMNQLGVASMRDDIDGIDREILRLIAHRRSLAVKIGLTKAGLGMPLRAPRREAEILDRLSEAAQPLSIDEGHVRELFRLILRQSRAEQRRALAAVRPTTTDELAAGGR
jgi:3-deoxy-7-phosphoheptulonate synthase